MKSFVYFVGFNDLLNGLEKRFEPEYYRPNKLKRFNRA